MSREGRRSRRHHKNPRRVFAFSSFFFFNSVHTASGGEAQDEADVKPPANGSSLLLLVPLLGCNDLTEQLIATWTERGREMERSKASSPLHPLSRTQRGKGQLLREKHPTGAKGSLQDRIDEAEEIRSMAQISIMKT